MSPGENFMRPTSAWLGKDNREAKLKADQKQVIPRFMRTSGADFRDKQQDMQQFAFKKTFVSTNSSPPRSSLAPAASSRSTSKQWAGPPQNII